jgi:peptidoglycan-associated lipoprotein
MNKRFTVLTLLLVLCLLLTVGACKKKQQPTTTPEPETTPAPAPPPEPPPVVQVPDDTEAFEEEPIEAVPSVQEVVGMLNTIFFAFDKYDLTDSARQTLQGNSRVMKNYPDYGYVIQGHCDERGTIEYNLALGQKRANAVREYLVSLGVPQNRIRVVSYGEERPAAQGHGESAWSKNRRAEFEAEQ